MRMPTLSRAANFRVGFRPSQGDGPETASESGAKLEKLCRLCRKRRRGAAAVEFAVVAPVFFLLIFGMIEFGRMVMVQQIITNASREGARVAVLDGTTRAEVEQKVQDYLQTAQLSGAAIDLAAIDDQSGLEKAFELSDYGDAIEVTVTIPFGQVSWLPSPMLVGGDTQLMATTTMRRETVQ